MAARRKGWNELSPTYRARLQRGGIDEIRYVLGASLSKARGQERENVRRRAWRQARRQFQGGRSSVYESDDEIRGVFDAVGYEAALQVLESREMAIKGVGMERDLGNASMRLFYGLYADRVPDEWLYYNDYTF